MKKHFVTLFALLSMMAVSCQKENTTEMEPTTIGESVVYTLSYTIDGASRHITFHSKAERLAFIRQLMAFTREGHTVSIGTTTTTNAAKEKVTFTTPSLDEATAWVAEMEEQGYVVTFYYDKEKGVYVCIAIK